MTDGKQINATQEARRAAALMAEEEMAEAERAFAEERAKLLEESEAAAAVAAAQVKTIGELQALEASTRRELDKTRRESERKRTFTYSFFLCL